MVVLVAITITLLLTLFGLKKFTLKTEDLIEGVFCTSVQEYDLLGGGEFIEYRFHRYCKDCILSKDGRRFGSIYGYCFKQFSTRALSRGSYTPNHGDSVRIIRRKNIFGTALSYEIIPTDFEKRFSDQLKMRETLEFWDGCTHTG